MKNLVLILVLLTTASVCWGQQADTQGVPDYCNFVKDQASAQRDLYRIPTAEIGPIQPSTGTPPQMVFGITESMSDLHKSGLVMKVAKTSCQLYGATTEAQMHLFYALPSVEKEVLQNRLDLIQKASDKLDGLIADNQKFVDAHNLTKPALYTLQGAKVRLDMSRTQTLTGLTTPYVPKLSSTPVRELIDTKMAAESDFQKASTRLQKQSAWDIKLSGGEHRQLSSVQTGQTPGGLYGEFSLTYNLGHHAASKQYDKSVDDYVKWKTTQFDDVKEQARILKQQINDTIKIQSDQLQYLLAHEQQITDNLTSLADVDSAAALTFKTQLLADKIVLDVDVQDVQFRIKTLQNYLQTNF